MSPFRIKPHSKRQRRSTSTSSTPVSSSCSCTFSMVQGRHDVCHSFDIYDHKWFNITVPIRIWVCLFTSSWVELLWSSSLLGGANHHTVGRDNLCLRSITESVRCQCFTSCSTRSTWDRVHERLHNFNKESQRKTQTTRLTAHHIADNPRYQGLRL